MQDVIKIRGMMIKVTICRGGGSEWTLQYGCIGFSRKKQVMGYDYELCRGKTYSKSANGTIIPASVKTKKEVLSIAKAIGILKTLV